MANLSQTPANVKIKSAGPISSGICGEALTQGQPVYQLGSKWFRAVANDTAAKANATRIVLVGGAIDGDCVLASPGAVVDLGATLAVGEVYAVSATAGAIAPIGDLVSTNRVTVLGIAETTSSMTFRPNASGAQKA